jgi:hypothetical protein
MDKSLLSGVPARRPVPEGKRRLCVAGYKTSPYTGHARELAGLIARKYSDRFESWFYFDESAAYFEFLKVTFDPVPFPPRLKGHDSSPFVWIETGPNTIAELIGGDKQFSEWAMKAFPGDKDVEADAKDSCWTCRVICCSTWFHEGKSYSAKSTADVSMAAGAPSASAMA